MVRARDEFEGSPEARRKKVRRVVHMLKGLWPDAPRDASVASQQAEAAEDRRAPLSLFVSFTGARCDPAAQPGEAHSCLKEPGAALRDGQRCDSAADEKCGGDAGDSTAKASLSGGSKLIIRLPRCAKVRHTPAAACGSAGPGYSLAVLNGATGEAAPLGTATDALPGWAAADAALVTDPAAPVDVELTLCGVHALLVPTTCDEGHGEGEAEGQTEGQAEGQTEGQGGDVEAVVKKA
eukprot:Selendium_serpulae@DN5222_c0_g1_i2.p1